LTPDPFQPKKWVALKIRSIEICPNITYDSIINIYDREAIRMRIYIHTTGCSISQALGEILRGILSHHTLVTQMDNADIIILNLCAVKKPTEDRGVALAKKISRMGKMIIITGCLAEGSHTRIIREIPGANIISISELMNNPDEILTKLSSGEHIIKVGVPLRLTYPTQREQSNPLIAIIPICFGCINSCSFCIDRIIWGRPKSIPIDQILKEIKRLLKNGAKEIRLTAHDTAVYGYDRGHTLVDLLEKILEIPGDYRIRIGMASPNTFEKISDALLDIIKNEERIYKFIHIPLQSGSDRILRLMNRPYTAQQFRELYKKSRRKLGDDATIATDIITAFPTETESDHQATVKLLQELKPDIVNISRYGDRPGVPSAKLKPKIHSRIAKRRTKEIFELVRRISYEKNMRFIGRTLDVLYLEKRGLYLGRAYNNRIVYVKHIQKLGEFYTTKISRVTWKSLYGETTM